MKKDTGSKMMTWKSAKTRVREWQAEGKRVVFTNGCFDLLHLGHVRYLEEAAELGDKLVIGVNSDESTRALKGRHRPINPVYARMYLLAALGCVDAVIEFDQPTPFELIELLHPDVLVKGGDYTIDDIVGAEIVHEKGGKVTTIPFTPGYSTSSIEQKILDLSNIQHNFNENPES